MLPRILAFTSSLLLAALGAVRPAAALTVFDFEQPYFSEYPLRIKDHSLIRVDGTYHLFYIRDTDENDFGHATSPDLIHWTIHPPVMTTVPGTWESRHIWAPAVYQFFPGVFHMFYTGVNGAFAQQVGLATSFDLWSWSEFNLNPIFHPDTSWAVWDPSSWSNCRDPDVFFHDGQYHMINTALHKWFKGAISHATSSSPFEWTDAQWIYRHNTYHVLESCQMVIANGLYHLFFTDEGVPGTSYMSSPVLANGYDINKRIVIDRGHAPEIDEFDPGVRIFSRHAAYNDGQGNFQYVIGFDTLEINVPTPFVWPTLRISPDWIVLEGTAFTFQPTFRNNAAHRGETVASNHVGDSWISTYEFFQGPLGAGFPGGVQGTGPQGTIRSKSFVIEGNSVNFLIGGGHRPNECYLALIDEGTGSWVRRSTGTGSYSMQRSYWDVRDLRGRSVHFVIADSSSASDGYINVDDIRESFEIVSSTPIVDDDSARRKEDLSRSEGTPPGLAVEVPAPISLHNEPNPFNPTTSLVYSLPKRSRVRVRIFNSRGALVRDLYRGIASAGENRVVWNGRDDHGEPVSSGVYFFALDVEGRPAGRHKLTLIK